MPRLRFVAPLTAILVVAVASVALAAKVTGGTSTLTVNAAAKKFLVNNHITVKTTGTSGYIDPLAGSLTLPIARGSINKKTLNGVIVHKGAVVLSKGSKSITLRDITVVKKGHAIAILAAVRDKARIVCVRVRHHRLRCARVLVDRIVKIANVTGGSVKDGTATGTVRLSSASAALVNKVAGKHVVSAGYAVGTGSTTPTFS